MSTVEADLTRSVRERTERIKPEECWELLAREGFGRLALAVADGVDIVPLNFVVDRRSIVLRTAEGSKLTEMSRSSAVALEIDDRDPVSGVAWSVVAKGRPRILTAEDEVAAVEALGVRTWSGTSKKMRYVRIEISEVTGRRFHGIPTA
ncbi:pyridoxamine 5'-phosphate oxidase family protein [Kineosporia babensis]|uniref:Pyridoxamine 5'-phosphate oxidase family protein n=1 Tax=Kineosporia babensis TaxID=499548 RepID=A0A9X1N8W1_9ACTN|nr:pyridoxamine 5'-phosphate oxidase family protein [Kineosporia babensis]MCD5310667.1 pyridoxamine 5'-phosphate oxidase family protein [Kineosporia babensis]